MAKTVLLSPTGPLGPERPPSGTPSTVPGDDEPLDELPPLDDDAAEPPRNDADLAGLVDDSGAEEGGWLDDRTAEDDPVDVAELDLREENGPADEPTAEGTSLLGAGEFDLGLPGEAQSVGEDDHPADDAALLDDDPGDDPDDHTDLRSDAGEEGPLSEEDEVSEGALPDLDADEEGSPEDAPAPALEDEPAELPWAAQPWVRVGAPWPIVDATAIACAGTGAVAVARLEGGAVRLVRLDLEGACDPVVSVGLEPARVRSLSGEGDTVVAWTDAGLFASSDRGSVFAPADAGDGSGSRGVHARLLADAPDLAPGAPVAVRGGMVAYGARKGGIARGGKGRAWSPVVWDGKATALAFLDDDGTLAVATYSDAEDTTALVQVSAAGEAVVLARLGPARAGTDADARVVAMAYDDARGVLWVAGGFGVAAFARASAA